MNIFQIILQNFTARSRTLKPEDQVTCQGGFRGELVHQPGLCTLCGTCSYMCSPSAISQERGKEEGIWKYDAGRCTFCGRCVEYCPTGALSFLERPGAVVRGRAEEITSHVVPYQRCKRCDAVVLPLAPEVAARLYHAEADVDGPLCERCRQRLYSEHLKAGMGGRRG